jgi:hypothetical protein
MRNMPECIRCGAPAAFALAVTEPYVCLTCQAHEHPVTPESSAPRAVGFSDLLALVAKWKQHAKLLSSRADKEASRREFGDAVRSQAESEAMLICAHDLEHEVWRLENHPSNRANND